VRIPLLVAILASGTRMAAQGASDRLAISLIARDAELWTGYSGLDPELAASGAFGQAPIPVRLSLRVELGAPLP
jgi:hypothetical protein